MRTVRVAAKLYTSEQKYSKAVTVDTITECMA